MNPFIQQMSLKSSNFVIIYLIVINCKEWEDLTLGVADPHNLYCGLESASRTALESSGVNVAM